MHMNLHELIRTPGSALPFRRELSEERLAFGAILSFSGPPVGEGRIFNHADMLSLSGVIRADAHCRCDRCAREFERTLEVPAEARLAAELEDEEDPDYYLLEGDELDIDDLLESVFILNMDQQMLCRDDCKGLCPRCGADLNEGDCSCRRESDPRLAVLGQLLDDIDQTI